MESVLLFIVGLLLGMGSLGWWVLRLNSQLTEAKSQLQNQANWSEEKLRQAEALRQESQANLELVQKQMSEKFELLAGRIFEERTQKLGDLQSQGLSRILDPFRERLKDFEKKVEETYAQERTDRGSLRGELSKLMELNVRMSTDATSLTRALRGDTRTQGRWGEMILENILERSGLRRNEEYLVQGTENQLRNEAGVVIRPDVIVRLPEGRHIIIDSKVSLTAFDQYVNCEDSSQQELFAKAHSESLKRHIDELSTKKYQTADQLQSPDFVILFMPLEPAFALAMRQRPDLQQEAWEKQIAIVSPTTLLVTLKMVAKIWETERQERNALEIAEKGGLLYDKFVGLINDLDNVGKRMDDSRKAFDGAMTKLQGKGGLKQKVEQLRELGVKTSKRLQLDTKDETRAAVEPSNEN